MPIYRLPLDGVDISSTRIFGCSSFDVESFGDFLTKDKAKTLLHMLNKVIIALVNCKINHFI